MARSEDILIPAQVWTQITNDDVTTITFQNKSTRNRIQVQATVGAVAPTGGVEGTIYEPSGGEYDLPLATAFSGVPGANRVWVYAVNSTEVFVSHA